MSLIVRGNKRRRYIGFTIKKNEAQYINKTDFFKTLQIQCKNIYNRNSNELGINIIRFNGSIGIVRCHHIEKENVIKILNSIKTINERQIKISTVGTSGTIRSLLSKNLNLTFNKK